MMYPIKISKDPFKMRIPYNYLPMEFKNNNEIFKHWKKLIRSTDFTLGQYMIDFENKFKKYVNAKYCIATNNGTDALILSLKSLGIGKGDEVITVTNTFYATVGAIVAVGAVPVLCDSDERFQIDVDKIPHLITKKTKAIVPVHWGGASPNMEKILKIAKKHKLLIVEDACMGIGAKINKKSPGTFGNVGAFSMHPLKSLNVMGDGGAVVTNDKKIYEWMLKYRNHGMINRNENTIWGVNYRMQPLQAIVAINGLKKINKVISQRNLNAKFYDTNFAKLKSFIRIPSRPKGYIETYALYMIECKNRDNLLSYLIKNKIEAKVHYPKPLHLQKAYTQNFKKTNLPISEYQSKNIITLPVHQFLTKKQLKFVVNKITSFYSKN